MREPQAIDALLIVWQCWAMYRIENALGHQWTSVLWRIMTEGLQGASIKVPAGCRYLPTDETAEAVEAGIVSLPLDLRRAVVIAYLGRSTQVQKAREPHVSYESFRYRLRQARSMLAESQGI